jgi:hypothetical protein
VSRFVVNAGERWPVGQNRQSNNRWGRGPSDPNICGKCLSGNAQLIKHFFDRRFGHYRGCPKWGVVPESALAPWMAKPLGGSLKPPEAWMS